MAQPISGFAVVEVAKPNIGEKKPSRVRADVTVILSVKTDIKSEWENLRKRDVCFLVTIKPTQPIGMLLLLLYGRGPEGKIQVCDPVESLMNSAT